MANWANDIVGQFGRFDVGKLRTLAAAYHRVNLAVAKFIQYAIGLQTKKGSWETGLEVFQSRDEPTRHETGGASDRQCRVLDLVAHLATCGFKIGKGGGADFGEDFSFCGQSNAIDVAIEQGFANPIFQRAYLVTHGAMGNAKALCRLSETILFGDRFKD